MASMEINILSTEETEVDLSRRVCSGASQPEHKTGSQTRWWQYDGLGLFQNLEDLL